MNAAQVLVEGVLKPDGTLDLTEAPQLPAGPVEVLIRARPVTSAEAGNWWEYLQRARGALLAQGHVFRDRVAIDADRTRQRNADEARRQGLHPAPNAVE